MDYGRAIRIVRTAHDLTQAELADRLSIGSSQLSLIEAGRRQPSLNVLEEVSNALGVPAHLLTLLASELEDIDDKRDSPEIAELAKALLKLLVSAGRQPTLPMKARKRARHGPEERPATVCADDQTSHGGATGNASSAEPTGSQ